MACDLVVAAEGTQARRAGDPLRVGAGDAAHAVPHRPEEDPRAAADRRPRSTPSRRSGSGWSTGSSRPTASRPRSTRSPTASPASPPDVMAPTKLMLNRAMDAAGLRGGGRDGPRPRSRSSTCRETSREFDAIVRRDGLKAALAWRDARYDERLRDAGRTAGETARLRSAPDAGRVRCARHRRPCAPHRRPSVASAPDRTGRRYLRRWSRRPVSAHRRMDV